jgi:hypothetical protein
MPGLLRRVVRGAGVGDAVFSMKPKKLRKPMLEIPEMTDDAGLSSAGVALAGVITVVRRGPRLCAGE